MLQMFHLYIAKVDRGVAWRDRCLSLMLGHNGGSTHVGFLCARTGWARVPATDMGAGAECGRGSSAVIGAASGCDVPSGRPGAGPSEKSMKQR
jgi:hypothetical protein